MADRLIIEEAAAESQRGNSISAAGCEAIVLEEEDHQHQSIRKEKADYNKCAEGDGDENENRQKVSRKALASHTVSNKEPEAELLVQNQGSVESSFTKIEIQQNSENVS